MVSVNCAAIPESLIEAELFGHVKGAFTGATQDRAGLIESADGSTLFLDEIGELPLEAQSRLLRVLQEGEIRKVGSTDRTYVNVRLVAATHRNLLDMVSKGQFREDLYYRLNVIELRCPPLRDRGEDIMVLAEAVLDRVKHQVNRPELKFSGSIQASICRSVSAWSRLRLSSRANPSAAPFRLSPSAALSRWRRSLKSPSPPRRLTRSSRLPGCSRKRMSCLRQGLAAAEL